MSGTEAGFGRYFRARPKFTSVGNTKGPSV